MKKILLTLFIAAMTVFISNATPVKSYETTTFTKNVECVKVNIPSTVKTYQGDSLEIKIRTTNKFLYDNIHYRVNDNCIDIWIENLNVNELYNINSGDIRIAIASPKELKIKTNNNFLLKHNSRKKISATSYENN